MSPFFWGISLMPAGVTVLIMGYLVSYHPRKAFRPLRSGWSKRV